MQNVFEFSIVIRFIRVSLIIINTELQLLRCTGSRVQYIIQYITLLNYIFEIIVHRQYFPPEIYIPTIEPQR